MSELLNKETVKRVGGSLRKYDTNLKIIALDKEELPVRLPENIDLSKPGNPLDNHPTWKYTKCRKTGMKA